MVAYIPRWFTCPQTVSHPSTNHLIATRPGVKPRSQVKRPNCYQAKLTVGTSATGRMAGYMSALGHDIFACFCAYDAVVRAGAPDIRTSAIYYFVAAILVLLFAFATFFNLHTIVRISTYRRLRLYCCDFSPSVGVFDGRRTIHVRAKSINQSINIRLLRHGRTQAQTIRTNAI